MNKSFQKIIIKINEFEPELLKLSDQELKNKTFSLVNSTISPEHMIIEEITQ